MLSSKKKEPAPEISARTRATKSRQLAAKKEVISRTGVVLDKCYCRKCMKNKAPIDFFESVDNGLVDSNGKFSVCKECCNDLFERFYEQNNSLEKSLLKTCRIINIRFDDVAVRATLEHVSEMMENDKEVGRIFSVYKAKLMRTQKTSLTNKDTSEDFTFVEPTVAILSNPLDDSVEGAYDLKMFWGESLEHDDYVWLEKELSDWKKTHKSDTKAEETLLKEICYKGLEIRNARRDGRSPGSLVKDYQELMKTANVDPSKTSIAGSGKSQDTFSSFIKTIEEIEPAEYFEDKKLFKDFDNLDFYFKKYVTRPLKNFITQSRDFSVDVDNSDDFEDFEIQDVLKDGD